MKAIARVAILNQSYKIKKSSIVGANIPKQNRRHSSSDTDANKITKDIMKLFG